MLLLYLVLCYVTMKLQFHIQGNASKNINIEGIETNHNKHQHRSVLISSQALSHSTHYTVLYMTGRALGETQRLRGDKFHIDDGHFFIDNGHFRNNACNY